MNILTKPFRTTAFDLATLRSSLTCEHGDNTSTKCPRHQSARYRSTPSLRLFGWRDGWSASNRVRTLLLPICRDRAIWARTTDPRTNGGGQDFVSVKRIAMKVGEATVRDGSMTEVRSIFALEKMGGGVRAQLCRVYSHTKEP